MAPHTAQSGCAGLSRPMSQSRVFSSTVTFVVWTQHMTEVTSSLLWRKCFHQPWSHFTHNYFLPTYSPHQVYEVLCEFWDSNKNRWIESQLVSSCLKVVSEALTPYTIWQKYNSGLTVSTKSNIHFFISSTRLYMKSDRRAISFHFSLFKSLKVF